MNRFEGKAAIVTGGASGIGAACCQRLFDEGARVAILDRNEAAAEKLAQEIDPTGNGARAYVVDVADPPALGTTIDNAALWLGRLDVAMNNAGIGGDNSAFEEGTTAFWDRTIAINLSSVYHGMRAQFAHMRENGGAIVNTASILGAVGFRDAAAYVAAKHGVIGLTRCAALSWGGHDIRVTAICPTFMRTPLNDTLPDELWPGLISQHPLKRLPTAEEVAAMAAYLASDEARAVSGSFHLIDAGYTAG